MRATFFGQYLLSKGVIDGGALVDAINRQRELNLGLTTLAVQHGYFDKEQEKEILARYRTTDAELEDLCLESGLLNRAQLEELIRIRFSNWMRIGGALVAGGHLTSEEVEELLETFQEVQRQANRQIETDFSACNEPETAKTVVTLAVSHLGRITGEPVKIRSLENQPHDLAAGWRRYIQRLVGDRELHVVLDLSLEMEAAVGLGLVGIPLEYSSEEAIDAVCEFVNIIGGNACTRLEGYGFRLRPEPPYSTVGNGPTDDCGPCVCAEVMVGDTELNFQVLL